jgi:hypothetical protein
VRPKIACVLQPSETYGNDYVCRLFEGLSAQVKDFEFITLRGSRWSSWWSKLELFDPAVRGDLLYFDLDTIITGSLADILSVRRLTVLSDFNRLEKMASGVMFIPEHEREPIWKHWIADPERHMQQWRGMGDQGYLSQFWEASADRWQDILPGQIVSYKNHWRKKENTSDSRVVCFHGKPKPRDVNWTL